MTLNETTTRNNTKIRTLNQANIYDWRGKHTILLFFLIYMKLKLNWSLDSAVDTHLLIKLLDNSCFVKSKHNFSFLRLLLNYLMEYFSPSTTSVAPF